MIWDVLKWGKKIKVRWNSFKGEIFSRIERNWSWLLVTTDQSSVGIGLVKEADCAQWVAHSSTHIPTVPTVVTVVTVPTVVTEVHFGHSAHCHHSAHSVLSCPECSQCTAMLVHSSCAQLPHSCVRAQQMHRISHSANFQWSPNFISTQNFVLNSHLVFGSLTHILSCKLGNTNFRLCCSRDLQTSNHRKQICSYYCMHPRPLKSNNCKRWSGCMDNFIRMNDDEYTQSLAWVVSKQAGHCLMSLKRCRCDFEKRFAGASASTCTQIFDKRKVCKSTGVWKEVCRRSKHLLSDLSLQPLRIERCEGEKRCGRAPAPRFIFLQLLEIENRK